MKERPILFNGEMVRAILDGRKTQTRRVVKPPKKFSECSHCDPFAMPPAVWWWDGEYKTVGVRQDGPFGVPGDRLYVREKWFSPMKPRNDCLGYAADDDYPHGRAYRVRPSIHMPKEHSRLLLEITGVRVERLLDIGEEDAKAEGFPFFKDGLGSPRVDYRRLWESINGPGSWAANPWVWVVEFKKVEVER